MVAINKLICVDIICHCSSHIEVVDLFVRHADKHGAGCSGWIRANICRVCIKRRRNSSPSFEREKHFKHHHHSVEYCSLVWFITNCVLQETGCCCWSLMTQVLSCVIKSKMPLNSTHISTIYNKSFSAGVIELQYMFYLVSLVFLVCLLNLRLQSQ